MGFLIQWKAYLDGLPRGPDGQNFSGKKLDPTVFEKVRWSRYFLTLLRTKHCRLTVMAIELLLDVGGTAGPTVRAHEYHQRRLETCRAYHQARLVTLSVAVQVLAYVMKADCCACDKKDYLFSQFTMTSTPFPTEQLLKHKARAGLTFQQIGEKLGHDEVWVAAAFYGQVNSILVLWFPATLTRDRRRN